MKLDKNSQKGKKNYLVATPKKEKNKKENSKCIQKINNWSKKVYTSTLQFMHKRQPWLESKTAD